jgi:hypothetical protein
LVADVGTNRKSFFWQFTCLFQIELDLSTFRSKQARDKIGLSLKTKMQPILSLLLVFIPFAAAQAPNGTSLCEYYSGSTTASNATDAQYKWITRFTVNVFGGNSSVFSGTTVQGVLSAGTYNSKPVRLVKYFDGSIYNTNGANGLPQAVNWLDDGGQIALAEGRLANSPTSNQ